MTTAALVALSFLVIAVRIPLGGSLRRRQRSCCWLPLRAS